MTRASVKLITGLLPTLQTLCMGMHFRYKLLRLVINIYGYLIAMRGIANQVENEEVRVAPVLCALSNMAMLACPGTGR